MILMGASRSMAIFDNIDEEELAMETTLFTARQIMTTDVVTVGPLVRGGVEHEAPRLGLA